MADDELSVVISDGSTKVLRSRDVGSAKQAQKIDVGPWVPTLVAGHQYNQTCATVFTMTVPSGATHAFITVDGGAVRMREDAADPTSTNGLYLPDGFAGELVLANALRFLQVSGTAKLNISYRKYI